jgi:hypothetical protein
MVCGKVIGNHEYTLFSGKYLVPNVSKRSLWTKGITMADKVRYHCALGDKNDIL